MDTADSYGDDEKIHAFWSSRAGLGQSAGTKDQILKKLEIEEICKYVDDGMRVLDVGCGNGITAIELARRRRVEIVAFDYVAEMIEAAVAMASEASLKGSVSFVVGDVRNMPDTLGKYDLIYSERTLINLGDWPTQRQTIRDIVARLVDGGRYLMCESSQDALDRLSSWRQRVGLSRIEPPWHNRYLRDAEIAEHAMPGVKLEGVIAFSSTYYFLSRIVNAWLAAQDGREPSYEAPVNQLALQLPPLGDLGQTRIWLWRKVGGGY